MIKSQHKAASGERKSFIHKREKNICQNLKPEHMNESGMPNH